MKTFFHHIQALWNMPHRFRSSYVRHTMTIEGYRILCKLKGEEFTPPPQTLPAGNYVITKYIRGSSRIAEGGRGSFGYHAARRRHQSPEGWERRKISGRTRIRIKRPRRKT